MSSIVIAGDTSGSVTIAAPAIAGTTVITLPATTGTLISSGGALGTPSSGTLTSCTGLPMTTGVTGTLPIANGGTNSTSTAYCSLTTNISGTLPVANGGSGVTSSTGTVAVVLSTSPTLVTPLLGTPTSGVLTNCTGLPVAGGGTGVATTTAYGVLAGGTTATGAFQNIGTGTATQVLTSNGAGALPTFQASSGGVTTFAGGTTGLTPAGATSGVITLAGTLAVANGGTGVTTSTGSGANALATSPTFSGQVSVAQSTSLINNGINLNAAGSGYLRGTANDGNSSTIANVQLMSWDGIGFSPSIAGQTVPQGENAVWISCRTGTLQARSTITAASFSGAGTGLTGIPRAALPAGSVLQVVSTTKTDTFTTSSTSPVDITGLSVSITPSSSSNKILITGSVCYGESTAAPYLMGFLLVRNSTNICIADAAGSRSRWTFGGQGIPSTDNTVFAPLNFLDSPATTSATTYKIQAQAESPQTIYINRGGESDGDGAITGRFTSTITVMEIAG